MLHLKKKLSVFLATFFVVASFSLCFIPGAAAAEFGDGLSWDYNSLNGTITISGTGAMPDLGFLETPSWFFYKSRIKKLVVESGITHVGSKSFGNCENLTSVVLADSVVSIGSNAFSCDTALTDVSFGSGLLEIGTYAFEECTALKSVVLPPNLQLLDHQAFNECSALSVVTLPNDPYAIHFNAFRACVSLTKAIVPAGATGVPVTALGNYLTEFEVAPGNALYSTDAAGVLYNKDKTAVVAYPVNKAAAYTLPDSVTEIGVYSFAHSKKTLGLAIPSQVTKIGDDAFYDSVLTDIALPRGIEIGSMAFADSNLQNVWFAGSEEEWNALKIGESNEKLLNADIRFNSPAPDHIAHVANVVQENVVAPTCTGGGSYDEVTYCARCGREFLREHKETGALRHDFNGPIVQNADGTYSYTCTRCGAIGDPMNRLPSDYCKYCLQKHTGFLGSFIAFFHKILYFFKNL